MPAWQIDDYIGIKIVTVFEGNNAKGLNSINGTYLLMDGKTGIPLCTMDAATVTVKRTAASSALASKFLSRSNSSVYTVLGTGNLCHEYIAAHTTVRPSIKQVHIWGRNNNKASLKANAYSDSAFRVDATSDKEKAMSESDIVSAITFSKTAIVFGDVIKPGTHIDLVGSYLPNYREADNSLIQKSRMFIDTDTALKETGDLILPMSEGVLTKENIQGNLIELCKREIEGRKSDNEITCFKSVGYALEDLAAGIYLYRKYKAQNEAL